MERHIGLRGSSDEKYQSVSSSDPDLTIAYLPSQCAIPIPIGSPSIFSPYIYKFVYISYCANCSGFWLWICFTFIQRDHCSQLFVPYWFRMGSCGSQPEVAVEANSDQKRENKKIDDGIAKEREQLKKIIKLLLLGRRLFLLIGKVWANAKQVNKQIIRGFSGPGESGKSTILKQMR